VGVDSKERAEIIELLFGTEGIVNTDDTIDFETKSVELKNKSARSSSIHKLF